jgi:divalent metal cation (Fe/Co/Zn/Cd) transporter
VSPPAGRVVLPAAGAAVPGPSPGDDVRALYRVMRWGFWSNLPVVALLIGVGATASSSAILVMMLQNVVDVIVQLFELYAIRQVIARDAEAFPYGAGKLENFAAFLWAVLTIPAAIYVLATAAGDLVTPDAVEYGVTILAILVSATRLTVLFVALRRVRERMGASSPVLEAYQADTLIDMLSNWGVVLSLAAGLALVSAGVASVGDRLDPAVAIMVAVYQLGLGGRIMLGNFRALMDLPLPVVEQLTVMRALAERHAAFEHIGAVETRVSGDDRIVDVELQFAPGTSIAHVEGVARGLRADLGPRLGGLEVRVAPRTQVLSAELSRAGAD